MIKLSDGESRRHATAASILKKRSIRMLIMWVLLVLGHREPSWDDLSLREARLWLRFCFSSEPWKNNVFISPGNVLLTWLRTYSSTHRQQKIPWCIIMLPPFSFSYASIQDVNGNAMQSVRTNTKYLSRCSSKNHEEETKAIELHIIHPQTFVRTLVVCQIPSQWCSALLKQQPRKRRMNVDTRDLFPRRLSHPHLLQAAEVDP